MLMHSPPLPNSAVLAASCLPAVDGGGHDLHGARGAGGRLAARLQAWGCKGKSRWQVVHNTHATAHVPASHSSLPPIQKQATAQPKQATAPKQAIVHTTQPPSPPAPPGRPWGSTRTARAACPAKLGQQGEVATGVRRRRQRHCSSSREGLQVVKDEQGGQPGNPSGTTCAAASQLRPARPAILNPHSTATTPAFSSTATPAFPGAPFSPPPHAGALLVRGVHEDASIQQGAVHVGHHGAHISAGAQGGADGLQERGQLGCGAMPPYCALIACNAARHPGCSPPASPQAVGLAVVVLAALAVLHVPGRQGR